MVVDFRTEKITCRPAADQWLADRNRRQLQVSGCSYLLWAGLGDEHQLHPEEGLVIVIVTATFLLFIHLILFSFLF